MAYEKPALLILSFASPAIRGFSDDDGSYSKGTHVAELGNQADGFRDTFDPMRDLTATSSTGSAYEADE